MDDLIEIGLDERFLGDLRIIYGCYDQDPVV
jgi:hypothetical protein